MTLTRLFTLHQTHLQLQHQLQPLERRQSLRKNLDLKQHHQRAYPQKSLPAKKRKITFDESTSSDDVWVGSLSTRHKAKITNNEALCSDIMNAVQILLKQQFPTVNGLQHTEKVPVWDEKQKKWVYQMKFLRAMSPAAQIHHNGKFHWVASVILDGKSKLFISSRTFSLSNVNFVFNQKLESAVGSNVCQGYPKYYTVRRPRR